MHPTMIPTDEPSLLSLLLCVSAAAIVLVVIVLDDTIVDVTDVTMPVPMEVTNIDVVVLSSSTVEAASLLNISEEIGMTDWYR